MSGSHPGVSSNACVSTQQGLDKGGPVGQRASLRIRLPPARRLSPPLFPDPSTPRPLPDSPPPPPPPHTTTTTTTTTHHTHTCTPPSLQGERPPHRGKAVRLWFGHVQRRQRDHTLPGLTLLPRARGHPRPALRCAQATVQENPRGAVNSRMLHARLSCASVPRRPPHTCPSRCPKIQAVNLRHLSLIVCQARLMMYASPRPACRVPDGHVEHRVRGVRALHRTHPVPRQGEGGHAAAQDARCDDE